MQPYQSQWLALTDYKSHVTPCDPKVIATMAMVDSAFYPWSAVLSLHFTLSLPFTSSVQSAVCVLHWLQNHVTLKLEFWYRSCIIRISFNFVRIEIFFKQSSNLVIYFNIS